MAKDKNSHLTPKQKVALELLTSGKGMTYKEIAAAVPCNPKTLYDWQHNPEYTLFQQELKKLNDEKWMATVEAAREAALQLCKDKNQKMVEFVLKNEGYNPTQKVEADVRDEQTITISIEE